MQSHAAPAALLLAVILAGIIVAPYNKVEESFNTQAAHDILFHGTDLAQYDHFEHPGPVPRTFAGALYLSMLVKPLLWLADVVGIDAASMHITSLQLIRAALGCSVFLSYLSLAAAVRRVYGVPASRMFLLITACQFHATFWASRTLPNTFAFALVNLAWSRYLIFTEAHALGRSYINARMSLFRQWTALLVFATVVFRSELLALMAPLYLLELWQRGIALRQTITFGTACGVASVAATMLIDSYFWQKPFMFPELHVLLFNTVHDQSHLWGVSPFHAYFTTLLPNMVLWVLPCAAIAFVTQVRLRKILLVVTAFVALYSFLPHKEWRFIIYAVPIYNLATAVVLSQWVQNTKRSAWVPKLVVMALLLGSMLVTLGKTAVSAANYPGGLALSRLGDHLAQHHIRNATVFVDDLTAQSGASRFLQTPGITYTQDERLAKEDRARFDFALIESGYVPNWQSHNFESIAAVAGFDGIDVPLLLDIVRWRKPVSLLPSAARISPRIHILQRNDL